MKAVNLLAFIKHLHSIGSREINRLDGVQGRKVWFQYWETLITFENSYLARLNYVNNNPARHVVVLDSREYEWCSARWFEKNVRPEIVAKVAACKTDKLNVVDDF